MIRNLFWIYRRISPTRTITGMGLVLLALVALFSVRTGWTAPSSASSPRALGAETAIAPVLHYQGRLLDPATDAAKPDGAYEISFRLYNVDTGGTPLWTETKDVTVSRGLFNTLLGDTTALPANVFNGQNLWLGIKVGLDSEAAPRQRMAPVAYALYADNADRLDGQQAAAFAAAGHTHTGSDIVDGSVQAADLAANSVDSSKIIDGTVGDPDIQDRTRILSFPATALGFDPSGAVIQQTATGLNWQQNFSGSAFLNIARPDDWDGTSDVEFTIHFFPTTGTSGNVDFFIRPRSYNPGDVFSDISNLNATPVAVSQTSVVKKQSFAIPASRLAKELWVISIQNQGSGSTYPDPVRVMTVSLSYTAVR